MTDARKIIKLSAANVQRIEAVEIEPDGAAVVIGGRNAQGKTSILDAIEYALGGKGTFSAEPVRRGAAKAEIVVDLGDLVVTRTITAAGGGALKVTSADGAAYASPQAILDKLVGTLAFDPLGFMRQRPAEQAHALAKIVGLDLDRYDRERKASYEDRTVLSRRVKVLEGALATLPAPVEAGPDGDLPTILARQAEVESAGRSLREATTLEYVATERMDRAEKTVSDLIERIAAAKDELEVAIRQHTARQEGLEAARAAVEALPPASEVRAQVQAAHEREQARARHQADAARREATAAELDGLRREVQTLTAAIDAVDAARNAAVAGAAFPVEGLAFADGAVTYRGLPLAQASGAERLRVSMAIALAMNPNLRIALIRDGSLLDAEGLALVRDMAAERGAQVWIERVGSGPECSVVIEDGRVHEPSF
jgi:hypothetical protein